MEPKPKTGKLVTEKVIPVEREQDKEVEVQDRLELLLDDDAGKTIVAEAPGDKSEVSKYGKPVFRGFLWLEFHFKLIHCIVNPKGMSKGFHCTFIYAYNTKAERDVLWNDLRILSGKIDEAWIALGDFNCVLEVDERIGAAVTMNEIADFRNCVDDCNLYDMKYGGNHFTWNNKQEGAARVFSKIDRGMVNDKWTDMFKHAEMYYHNEGDFDHCPGVIYVFPDQREGKKPFRYFNLWSKKQDFKDNVKQVWKNEVKGTMMYDLHMDPRNMELREKEMIARDLMVTSQDEYNSYLRQKAKVDWIIAGDLNTRLFHRSLNKRQIQDMIYTIQDMNGEKLEDIPKAFLEYYDFLLGKIVVTRKTVNEHIVKQGPLVTEEQKTMLSAPFNKEEVKAAMFSIDEDKASGPDGFGSNFFKECLDIVGSDINRAVLNFQKTGKLPKEINTTSITLIPKTKCLVNVKEFRPISYCNVVYKCIAKVLCKRLKKVLPEIIAENQSAFVHSRYIVHNIMICQDLELTSVLTGKEFCQTLNAARRRDKAGKTKFQKGIIRVGLLAVIYWIWKARNTTLWDLKIP
uniref:Reverse transcriptase domain-containing protein n=1 Tax=Chenopodium quinoa TaxID=63459 RepID=A0A803LM05_CHEQI